MLESQYSKGAFRLIGINPMKICKFLLSLHITNDNFRVNSLKVSFKTLQHENSLCVICQSCVGHLVSNLTKSKTISALLIHQASSSVTLGAKNVATVVKFRISPYLSMMDSE